jgi:hypothetical protein
MKRTNATRKLGLRPETIRTLDRELQRREAALAAVRGGHPDTSFEGCTGGSGLPHCQVSD